MSFLKQLTQFHSGLTCTTDKLHPALAMYNTRMGNMKYKYSSSDFGCSQPSVCRYCYEDLMDLSAPRNSCTTYVYSTVYPTQKEILFKSDSNWCPQRKLQSNPLPVHVHATKKAAYSKYTMFKCTVTWLL